MLGSTTLTEAKMIETFGKPLADRVRLLTFSTDAVFDEFNFKGRTYLSGYDYYRKSYYVLTENAAKPAVRQQGGTIVVIRNKQEKRTQIHRLEMVHN